VHGISPDSRGNATGCSGPAACALLVPHGDADGAVRCIWGRCGARDLQCRSSSAAVRDPGPSRGGWVAVTPNPPADSPIRCLIPYRPVFCNVDPPCSPHATFIGRQVRRSVPRTIERVAACVHAACCLPACLVVACVDCGYATLLLAGMAPCAPKPACY
jgi:hypothetical protein